jgi:hypothetical protein
MSEDPTKYVASEATPIDEGLLLQLIEETIVDRNRMAASEFKHYEPLFTYGSERAANGEESASERERRYVELQPLSQEWFRRISPTHEVIIHDDFDVNIVLRTLPPVLGQITALNEVVGAEAGDLMAALMNNMARDDGIRDRVTPIANTLTEILHVGQTSEHVQAVKAKHAKLTAEIEAPPTEEITEEREIKDSLKDAQWD